MVLVFVFLLSVYTRQWYQEPEHSSAPMKHQVRKNSVWLMAAFDVSQEPAAKKNTIGENIGIIVSLYMYVEPPIRFLFS